MDRDQLKLENLGFRKSFLTVGTLEPRKGHAQVQESLYEAGIHPKSETMPWLTWQESASVLTGELFGSFESKV